MNWKSHTKNTRRLILRVHAHVYLICMGFQKCINDADDGVNFDEPHRLHVPLKCYNVIICLPFIAFHDFDFGQRIMIFERCQQTRNKQTNEQMEMNKFTIKLINRNFGQFFNECIILCAIQIIHVRLIS